MFVQRQPRPGNRSQLLRPGNRVPTAAKRKLSLCGYALETISYKPVSIVSAIFIYYNCECLQK